MVYLEYRLIAMMYETYLRDFLVKTDYSDDAKYSSVVMVSLCIAPAFLALIIPHNYWFSRYLEQRLRNHRHPSNES